MSKIVKNGISRRTFLKGTAVGAAAIMGAGLLSACSTPAAEVPSPGADSPTAAPSAGDAAPAAAATDWLGTEPVIADSEITQTIETELLIVGAGHGGMFAAATAAELGAKTIVIERNGVPSTVRDDISAVGSRLQNEWGAKFDKFEMIRQHYMYCAGRMDQRLAKIWTDNSANTVNWYEDLINARGAGSKLWSEGGYGNEYGAFFTKFPTGHSPEWAEGMNGATLLKGYAEELGVEFMFETKMVKLVKDGAKVTGLIAETPEGYVKFVASKGVIVSAGGYEANEDMMKALQPETVKLYTGSLTGGGSTGDGIKACIWAGAKFDDVHTSMLFDRCALKPGETVEQNTGRGFFWIGSQPFLKVNLKGERFTNESGCYDFILHAASMQPKNLYCTIWDADIKDDIARFGTVGCSRMTNFPNGAPPNMPVEAAVGMIDGLIADGFVQQADTIEELAEKLGLPVDTFKATVDRYNQIFDAQVDDDFGKEPARLSCLKNPPFYGAVNTGSMLCTMDGIRIDTNMHAVDENCDPIEGLYVIGNCSGGYYAHTYPNLFTGHAAGRTATFAQRAVRVALTGNPDGSSGL